MIDDLRPHSDYREVGLPWLQTVPSHWEVKRAKSVIRSIDVRSTTGEEELLTVSSSRGVVPRSSATVTMFKAESYKGYKLCWPNDLVINSLWAWGRGLGVSRLHGIISTAYGVYRARKGYEDHVWYLHHLVRSDPFNWELHVRSKGIWKSRLQLTDQSFLNAPIPLPPPVEAGLIVRFLAEMDRRINRLVRNKRRLIELLNEQKQAIITQAVTRGLDPSVPMKPSRIDWLGEIPKHWDVWKIGHFARVGNGSTPSRSNPSYWQNGRYPWLNSSTVNQGVITESDQFVTATAINECHLPQVDPGSVLVAITGQGKTRGTAAVLRINATINQHIAYITPRTRRVTVNPEHLRVFFIAAYPQLRRMSDDSGSTKGALTCSDLRHFHVVVPPAKEQESVVAWIKNNTQEVESAIGTARREIELIREFRARLVADVVTGALDVRGIAEDLPEVAEVEHEPLPTEGEELEDAVEEVES